MSQPWTPPASGGADVPNYLVLAILSIFCCTPLGIAAIIFATQVNSKVQAGDIAGAMEASKKAKMFAFIGIGLGLVGGIIGFLMGMLGAGIGAINS